MLSQAQLDEFAVNGCLRAPKILTDAEIQELRDELARVIARGKTPWPEGEPQPVSLSVWNVDGLEVMQIVNIWEASPAFERLLYHPVLTAQVAKLIQTDELIVWHDQIQYKPAGHGGINMWHQDWPYWPIIRDGNPVSIWIPLDDVDVENGCMWMVPGSQRWGDQINFIHTIKKEDFYEPARNFKPPEGSPSREAKAIPWPMEKGGVSFHHSLTWHGSHKNLSDRPRRAIALHYMSGKSTYYEPGNHLMKRFIPPTLKNGDLMRFAGPHFPITYTAGKPVSAPTLTVPTRVEAR